MVGFLAQVSGAELYLFNQAGDIVETKTYRAGVPPPANSMVAMLSGTEDMQTGPASSSKRAANRANVLGSQC